MKAIQFKIIAIFVCAVVLCAALVQYHQYLQTELGRQAVMLMYNFSSLQELDRNMTILQDITTEDVYRQLDINYNTRVIGVYYKFQAEPTKVEIVSVTPTSVCYRLENTNIDYSRLFLLRFETKAGKIAKVSEYELVVGIDDYGGVAYE